MELGTLWESRFSPIRMSRAGRLQSLCGEGGGEHQAALSFLPLEQLSTGVLGVQSMRGPPPASSIPAGSTQSGSACSMASTGSYSSRSWGWKYCRALWERPRGGPAQAGCSRGGCCSG